MRNSPISAYSNVGTNSSNIELTAFKSIQSSNNLILGTTPYTLPLAAWTGWELNETANAHSITPPTSVHPSPDARCTFYRSGYSEKLVEGEVDATAYNMGYVLGDIPGEN